MADKTKLPKKQVTLAEAKGLQKIIISMKKHWQIYLLVLPALVWYVIFAYYPMAGLQLALKTYKAKLGIWGSPWYGLGNFEAVFRDVSCISDANPFSSDV